MRARMARLLDAQLEERLVVVDDRTRVLGIALALFEREPISRVVGKQLEPVLVALRVEEPGFVVQELLDAGLRHGVDMYSSHACIWARMKTSLVPVAPRRTPPGSSTSRPWPRPM